MNLLSETIRSVYPVSDDEIKKLEACSRQSTRKKSERIISQDDLNNKVYLLLRGFARTFIYDEGKELTMWFVWPGEPLLMNLGRMATPHSRVNVDLLEDSVILEIDRQAIENLYLESLGLCNWARIMAERYLFQLEEFFTCDLIAPAAERYERMILRNPELLQKVPLKYLASFLLITPESLSRIRKNSVLGKPRAGK